MASQGDRRRHTQHWNDSFCSLSPTKDPPLPLVSGIWYLVYCTGPIAYPIVPLSVGPPLSHPPSISRLRPPPLDVTDRRHPPDHKQKALDDVIGTAFASDRLQVLGPRCGVGIRLLLGVFCLPCSFFNNCVTPFLFLSILLPLQPG